MTKLIESAGAKRLRQYMAVREWYTVKIPGGRFLSGFPDIYATHHRFGIRLIETKIPIGGKLSDSQIAMFRKLARHGSKIYVLHDETNYDMLFGDPNWLSFALGRTNIAQPKGLPNKHGTKGRLDYE